MKRTLSLIGLVFACLLPVITWASGSGGSYNLHMTGAIPGLLALACFAVAYAVVMTEEFTHLRKSKPVIVSAGVIWLIVALVGSTNGMPKLMEAALSHNILEYAELFLFLLVAMTYINALEERLAFDSLRSWLVRKGFSYRSLFLVTGVISFFLSPIADNLTTALLMCAVVMSVGAGSPRFIAISCVNIVVAANAGGAFSPFGDITTLMVWQDGKVAFEGFFNIFVPSVISYVIPAAIMYFAVPNETPPASDEVVSMKFGAKRIMVLFLATIATAIGFHHFLHLPPMMGMMTGLGYLLFFSYYLKYAENKRARLAAEAGNAEPVEPAAPFDIFNKISRAEWDTLLFFYGVILSVGGLAVLGYLSLASNIMYDQWGANFSAAHSATPANIVMGVLSAIIDNIPVMYAVLVMDPPMSQGQWLLVTLTAGIGGSMLSIGSAAGVALMGQAKGAYTFFSHLKWTWAIGLGYAAAIITHIWMNARLF